jgi:GNAT superfamily N-acetyltransferase
MLKTVEPGTQPLARPAASTAFDQRGSTPGEACSDTARRRKTGRNGKRKAMRRIRAFRLQAGAERVKRGGFLGADSDQRAAGLYHRVVRKDDPGDDPPKRPVSMVRDHLEDIPRFDLPKGFSLRGFRQGDQTLWRDIHVAADRSNKITLELFIAQFGGDAALLADRQYYLLAAEGSAIGTATAWFDPDRGGLPYGRIHWVAILPEWQGRGLAKPLMSFVCLRMRELGHERAYLTTSTARIPALNLYRLFGFRPEIRSAEDAAAWRSILPFLKRSLDWPAI